MDTSSLLPSEAKKHLQYYQPGVEELCGPIPNMSVFDFLDPVVKKNKNQTIRYGNAKIPLSTIWNEHAEMLSRALRSDEYNIEPGMVIPVYGMPMPGMLTVMKALSDIGACPYNLKLSATPEDFDREITENYSNENGQAKMAPVAVLFDGYYKLTKDVKRVFDDPRIKKVIVLQIADFLTPMEQLIAKPILAFDKFKNHATIPNDGKYVTYSKAMHVGRYNQGEYRVPFKEDSWGVISTSSGSSNKGIKPTIATHKAIIGQILQCDAAEFGYEEGDLTYDYLPLTASTALACLIFYALFKGNDIYFDPAPNINKIYDKMMKLKFQNTILTGPWMDQLFFEIERDLNSGKIKPGDLFFLNNLQMGGANVSPPIWDWMVSLCKRVGIPPEVLQVGWGLSEGFAPMAKLNKRTIRDGIGADDKKHSVISVGSVMPAFNISVRDEEGNELPEGEFGEIWADSELITKGYFNKPEETNEILKNGQLKTADLGYLYNGQVYIIGRMDDYIIDEDNNKQYVAVLANQARDSHPAFRDCAIKKCLLEDGTEELLVHLAIWPEYNGQEDELIKAVDAAMDIQLPNGVKIAGYHIWGRAFVTSQTTAKTDPKVLIAQPNYKKPIGDKVKDIVVEKGVEPNTHRIVVQDKAMTLEKKIS